jgi:hypothetical protein
MTLRIVLIAVLLFASFGATHKLDQADQPTVVVAVAPPFFIPFMFDKTGSGSATVEVNIQPDGHVSSAKYVGGGGELPRDDLFEQTALRWRFSSTGGSQERTAQITFVLRIMPKETRGVELTTIYTAPYQMEIRHLVFDAPVTSDPRPIDTNRKRRP